MSGSSGRTGRPSYREYASNRSVVAVYSRRTTSGSASGARRRTLPCSASLLQGHRSRSRSGVDPAGLRALSLPGTNTGGTCLCLEGPLLLSAAHGKEVFREGRWAWVSGISGRRLHRREVYTTEIILRMFDSTALKSQASFIVWNPRALKDPRDGFDPNYLHGADLRHSQWHYGLHSFSKRYRGDPAGCVHFDIHGKKDRSGLHIDVGLEALRFHAPVPSVYDRVRRACEVNLSHFLASVGTNGKTGKRFGLAFPNYNERDNGFWQRTSDGEFQRPPEAPYTMVAQSCAIGILGIQLEIPKSLRAIIATSPRLIAELAAALNKTRMDLVTVSIALTPSASLCSDHEAAEKEHGVLRKMDHDSGEPSNGQDTPVVTPIPTEIVPHVVALLIRDACNLHMLDTEKPI